MQVKALHVIIALLLLILAFSSGWLVNGWRLDSRMSKMQKDAAIKTERAVQDARAIEKERYDARESAIVDAKQQAQKNLALATSANSELDRVRTELARIKRNTRNSPATGGSSGIQGSDPIGLLADMYEQGKRDALQRSQYADNLRVAGLTCEHLYDGLRTRSTTKSQSRPK